MTMVYEVTRSHHFIQKLKVLTHNYETKKNDITKTEHEILFSICEAIEELDKSINIILKELATQEQNNEKDSD